MTEDSQPAWWWDLEQFHVLAECAHLALKYVTMRDEQPKPSAAPTRRHPGPLADLAQDLTHSAQTLAGILLNKQVVTAPRAIRRPEDALALLDELPGLIEKAEGRTL